MLSTEQIAYIRRVLQNRGIETVDLLEEMTDHFVEAIEEREEDLKHTTLREVLRQEVATFGPFGMMKLQEEYQSKLEKQGLRILWSTFTSFWKLPQVIASLTFMYAVFLSIQHYQGLAVSTYKFTLMGIAVIYLALLIYLRVSLGKMAIFTKLYSSVYLINIPIVSTLSSIIQRADSAQTFDLQSQLIATVVLGLYMLVQLAGGLILYRSYGEIITLRRLKKI
jgi:hypothetical protein